jgi:hypothetical protein
MEKHPDIYLLPILDMAYFIEKELVGRQEWLDGEADAEQWERTHSPEAYAEHFREAKGQKAIGEKSADYLYWRPAHPRLARYLPEAKFIITLRNPVTRAWSHYWHEVGRGRETLGFEEALEAEEERCRRSAYARNHLSYLRRGFYAESLESLFSHIDPGRVLVVNLESSQAKPTERLQEVYRFLGVDPKQGLELGGTQHHANWATVRRGWAEWPLISRIERVYIRLSRNLLRRIAPDTVKRQQWYKYTEFLFRKPAAKAVMAEETRCRLLELYEPHIQALERMLHRTFPEWRK